MSNPQWSFSSIKLFEQCPRKYYHLKVSKDYSEPPTDATTYGEEFHSAAEFYVSGQADLPAHFSFAKKALDKLRAMPGKKLCEYEMGLTEGLEPCKIDAPDAWWRGIADLVIINENTAKVVDYKAGKSAKYADKDQLQLMALAVFKHFPDVEKVDAALLFVVAKAFITATYNRSDAPALWADWLKRYNKITAARDNGVWNPKTSGLCKAHCVVLSCLHNGRNS